ncbi:MAG TPA: DNA repair protein RecO [Thermoanaerobaculia bacterium]|nr:DNA repair protein RecO [Thermoanaerobaculia bacterium]
MRPEKSEAIILYTYASRERDKLVVFLTPDHGKMKGWAYGARSARSRFGASLEPLTKVHLTWYEKETEEVVRIEAIDLIRSLFSAQQHLVPSLAATYIAENVDTFALAHDPAELLYRLLDRTSNALLEGVPVEPLLAWFEIWMLRLAGIFPSIRECADCQRPLSSALRYDELRGVFLCDECGRSVGKVVPNDVVAGIAAILRQPVEEFAVASPRPELIFEIRAFARWLRRNFLGYELKSHDLLQQMLTG